MRISLLSLISFTIALASYVHAHPDHSSSLNEARSYADALSARDILDALSTRDLIDELSGRLERRAFVCSVCRNTFPSASALQEHVRREHAH
ncbi:hypothetical protein D9611_009580 [Ephemerocybe angulata]|uniref:C2H2-type domain-containing protein n=1 Tax=Ephemerocybe angulata TaxID=980116 RepID=A0A8H5C738_9AGAR|nr:hypothetical protein D9611_009580 [Tulosesus angulatus]